MKTEISKQKKTMSVSKPRFIFNIFLFLPLVFLHTHLPFSNGVSVEDFNILKHSEIDVISERVCTESIGECFTEPEMDSENNRRFLAMQNKRYISYDTLRRDLVPCDRAGASYYNCYARQANPYHRGCEVITRCARGINGIKN